MNKQKFIDYIREANPAGEGNRRNQILNGIVDTKSYHFTILSRGWVNGTDIEKWLKVVVYRTILGSKVNLRILSWQELDRERSARL